MRIAHLILLIPAPNNGENDKSLSHQNFDFYIHVDKKFDINPHLFLKSIPNVYFINNRIDVKWAGFSTVTATFECIKEIAATGVKYDYINFLSGQDYPIKSADYINDFLVKTKQRSLSYRDIRMTEKEGLSGWKDIPDQL